MTSTAGTTSPSSGSATPSAEDYRLLLDLREQIESHLNWLINQWYQRNRETLGFGDWPTLASYDEDEVTVTYYASNRDRLDFRDTHHAIPIGELFPDFAERQQLLKALAGGPA